MMNVQEITIEWPAVSIIIVSLNGRKWLKGLLKSILASNYPHDKLEIVFVDNGSTDGSIGFVKEMIGDTLRLKMIQNPINVGWSPANNQGMRVAKGEIIVCLSNDMEVDPNCVKEIVKIMKADKHIGVVQCNSLSLWDRRTSDSGMNYLDKFGYAYSYAPLEETFEVFFAEGMAFAIKREVIGKVGMLDDYYFMEYDDMDFSWRVRLAGYSVFFVPTAKVYHARGGTVGATYFQRVKNVMWYTRNHLVTLIKNYELKNLLKLLPIVLAVEIMKILYLPLMKKNWKVAYAALRGIFYVLKDFRIIFQKRMEVQRMRKISDKEIMKFMHPFNPRLLRLFLILQAKGKRLVLSGKPPMNEVKVNEKN